MEVRDRGYGGRGLKGWGGVKGWEGSRGRGRGRGVDSEV